MGRFPHNPNGSLLDIAGICDATGRVLGLMPHPEAHISSFQHPTWTREKEAWRRRGEPYPEQVGAGLAIFKNAVGYLEGKLQKYLGEGAKGKSPNPPFPQTPHPPTPYRGLGGEFEGRVGTASPGPPLNCFYRSSSRGSRSAPWSRSRPAFLAAASL